MDVKKFCKRNLNLLVILGVLIVVVLIFAFWRSDNLVLFGPAPLDFDAGYYSSVCEALFFEHGYCTYAIEIGEDEYVSCAYAEVEEWVNFDKQGKVEYCNEIDGAEVICNRFKVERGQSYDSSEVFVNEASCLSWGVE